jgi:hypothetical protein
MIYFDICHYMYGRRILQKRKKSVRFDSNFGCIHRTCRSTAMSFTGGRVLPLKAAPWLKRLVAGFPPRRSGIRARVWSCGILWWTKWRWGRFSPRTSVSPANLHSTNCSKNHPHLSSGVCTIGQKWPQYLGT